MFKRHLVISAVLLIFSLDIYAQDAGSHPLFQDDWLIRIGGQQADADVKFGLGNPELGDIPLIDTSQGNTDPSLTSIWFDAVWQGPEKWSFGFSYFQARVEGDRTTSEDLMFGDLEIPAGTGIQTDFETDFYVLNGYYDFFQSAGQSAGIGLGVYALDLSASVEAFIGGEATGSSESADALAPLPTLSAYYKHAFNENWAFRVNLSWLSLNIDKYDGSVLGTDLSVEYWPNEHWGVGGGYTYVDLDLTIDETLFDQRYEVQYDSFFLFATFGF
ncbi:MAG TPA: hypothetical protein VJ984_06260 [Xanthomonadales bacterium]|nr:hypothetical protein [Xanthomonadales bacterium]